MDRISVKMNFCGIYMITNYVSNKRYIGSSINVGQRLWTHRSELRHNSHPNAHLQNAWNKYGEENFNYTILEKCTPENRFEREQYYVDALKPEYNICVEVVQNPPKSEDTRKKHSTTRKRLMAEGVIPITNNKLVFVYYKDGSFVGKWESIRKAAKAIGIHYSSACRVLQGLDFQNSGYKLFTEEQHNIQPFSKPTNKGKIGRRASYLVTDGETEVVLQGYQAVADYVGIKKNSVGQFIRLGLPIKKKYKILKIAVS